MQLRFTIVLLLMGLLPLDSISQEGSDSLYQKLHFNWGITQLSEDGRIQELATDSLHQLSLDTTGMGQTGFGSYLMSYVKDGQRATESGSWKLDQGKLRMFFEFLPREAAIDSIVYQSSGQDSRLDYFAEGKKMATQASGSLESPRRTELYTMEWGERGELKLFGTGNSLELKGPAQLLKLEFSYLDILRGAFGVFVLLFVCWLFSSDRSAIDWRLVGTGIGLQLLFAILVLKVEWVNTLFSFVSRGFVTLLEFTMAGSEFMFGQLVDLSQTEYIFAFQVLPVIVFFSALTSLFYYLGILQRLVYGFAWVMSKTMRLSGAESLAAAGNIFLGQTEAPLLIKPYLPNMTRSEIMALMTGGMATIAGSVFGAYVGFLGGADPVTKQLFATHLLTASIMSAPAALVAAKILLPETQETLKDLRVPKDRIGSNVLDAITNGTTEGLKLAVNVGVMLLVFIAMIKTANFVLAEWIGSWGLNDFVAESTNGKFTEFGLEYIFGLVLSPIAWILGVPGEDIMSVGQLLGEKTVANEFVAYGSLGNMQTAGTLIYEKSVIIATYALCGFANFSSIGIQIGGISVLAPGQRKTLSELGIKSLIGGTIAAFLTAALAGMLLGV